MHIKEDRGKVIIAGIHSFSIQEVLECGQCFRFTKLDETQYKLIAGGKAITITQKNNELMLYPLNMEEFDRFWRHYLDLDRDYGAIKHTLSQSDLILAEAIDFAPGIRVLNQEFWECAISFIISQNNRIPRIKQIIENISAAYGHEIEGGYAFPDVSKLAEASVDDLMKLKTGFRAKYIVDAVNRRLNGELEETALQKLPTHQLQKQLMNGYGIGEKVADCIMLFGLGRKEVFPTDIWVKRVMQELYSKGENTRIEAIHHFAHEKWGNYAGFAQQYLFHYARANQIGA